MFAFKKLVSRLFFPIPLIVYPLIIGLLFLWLGKTKRKQRIGKVFICLGLFLFFLFSVSPLPDMMLRSLEHRHAPFDREEFQIRRGESWAPQYIVVLAGDFFPEESYPVTSRVGPRTTARVAEGVRLHRLFPDSQLVFTGGKHRDSDPWSAAGQMSELARLWGVEAGSIVVESESRDTKDHVRYLESRLRGESFVLVTSAAHLPRAMAMFEHAGLDPIPAPVTFYTKKKGSLSFSLAGLIPKEGKLRKAEGAFYEYFGLAWAKLRGQI